ncbi:VWA domain-containing protein [Candidatus Poribacteria bacterium]|nr:VWA domain-containing protein [Candidatus Poribacteria bacterium]MYG05409.1 VWA domain-containing protein [Candidatus Poribacteria bacterium]MYK22293.1 VWA domain-containing protein [Candidatus Poribacteria bacterium]
MKSETRLYRTWKTKSATRKALSVSLVFHLFFLITTFYVVVQNQPMVSEKASLAAELISVENAARPKPPLKKFMPRLHTPSREFADVTTAESPPTLVSPVAVPTENPRPALGRSLQPDTETEKPSAALDLSKKSWNDVSTAARTLRDLEGNLSKTEAASPAGDTAFGAKRPGPPRIQRAPKMSTLKIVEEEIPAALVQEIREKRKMLPKVSFPQVMKKLAQEIVETSEGGPIDVVFVIDASGSMGDNIRAVTEHLKEMVDIYKASKINYALGVTKFWAGKGGNKITVVQLTKSFTEYKRTLQEIITHQDENALDAVVQTVKELRFRPTSKKHFILVTDEPFTSRIGLSVAATIAHCREFGIYVNVLGLPLAEHQILAAETGGKWHLIPEDPRSPTAQNPAQRSNRAMNPRRKAVSLRNAQWTDVYTKIGGDVRKHGSYTPVDIILFVDSSESMDDKLPNFLQQLDILVRDWDNALIDYQIGVVRFRSRASVNMINVYNPPQTLEEVRKIVELPCQDDEMLLDAIADGLRRLKLRSNAKPYFILVTDEPAKGEYSPLAIIQMLEQEQVLVSVVGTYDDFQQAVATKTHGVWVPIPEGQRTNNSYW